jgi:hypothetical protein
LTAYELERLGERLRDAAMVSAASAAEAVDAGPPRADPLSSLIW